MPILTRRRWLSLASAAMAGGWTTSSHGRSQRPSLGVAAFRVDVTPPLGHPLLGGHLRPASGIDDPLFAHGLVLTGGEKPTVFVAVDWCEIRNEAYARWRELLAAACETTVENVLVACVHQHDAPYADLGAQRLLDMVGAGRMCDPVFHETALRRTAEAAKSALRDVVPLTQLETSRVKVEAIASSRRVLKPDGTPYYGRYSTCGDVRLRAQADGEIDPYLSTLTFLSGDSRVASLRSYAVHPMSRYGRGIVSGDFVGLARARRQRELPKGLDIYATGCAGDVTAGKYNDGSPGTRERLADRLHRAMVAADAAATRHAADRIACRALPIVLPYWKTLKLEREALTGVLRNEKARSYARAQAALGLSSLDRNADGHHLDLQAVDFGAAQVALFPAESFVSYQLQAAGVRPDSLLIGVGFGECAPGYIPTERAVREGFREEHGYCWVDDSAERRIVEGMRSLLSR